MGEVLNFWTEDEALDLFHHLYQEYTYENFSEYLEEYAPWLIKKKDYLWAEMNR